MHDYLKDVAGWFCVCCQWLVWSMGVFVDGNYYFASGNNADFTMAPLGVKFRF